MNILPVNKEPTSSGWYESVKHLRKKQVLNQDIDCDYLVVGGGWMGIHCAKRLAELDSQATVVLVDAGSIGNGSAGRCAGFAIDLAHNPRIKDFAEDKRGNREEYQINVEGIEYLRQSMEAGVECDWDPSGKYHAAASKRGYRCLQKMSKALTQLGKEHRWLDRDEIQLLTGSKHYFSAIHTPGTVLLQPAAYLIGLANILPDNIRVFEDTPVTQLNYAKPNHICTAPQGEIRTKNVMLCNAAYLTECGFFEKTAIPVYTYASMTRTLNDDQLAMVGASGPFGVIPADSFGTTMRLTQDRRLFLRNVYSYARGFQSTSDDVRSASCMHIRSFERRYPELAEIGYEHSWGGLLVMAQNGGMVFGPLADRVYGAAFCNGTGVARGAAFGKALAELALGQKSESIDILLSRPKPNRGYPEVLTELGVRANTSYRFWRAGNET